MRAHRLFAPLLVGSFIALQPQPAPAAALDVGDEFPDLVLPSLSGEPLSIAAFRGQKVAMHVWASW
ncbi:MAG: hypothetical protein AAGF23_07795 [Acidobacteriota bacterium]